MELVPTIAYLQVDDDAVEQEPQGVDEPLCRDVDVKYERIQELPREVHAEDHEGHAGGLVFEALVDDVRELV